MATDAGIAGARVNRRGRQERRTDKVCLDAHATCLAAALARLPQPILLVLDGRPIRVWYANAAARGRLTIGSHLRLHEDVLVIPDSPSGRQLSGAIRVAFAQGPACPQTVNLALEADGPPATTVHVEALDLEAGSGLPKRVVLVDIQEKLAPELALQRLCHEFGLTPMEAEIAISLYAKGSVMALTRYAGKSVHTVRSQLKAAMQKTNTHTQAGLVALVSRFHS